MRINVLPRIIILPFVVDPTLVGMAAIDATGRDKDVDDRAVKSMPHATVAKGHLHFFKVGENLKVGEPAIEAAKLGLHLADPHTLTAFNVLNPEFSNTHANATVWLNAVGIVCYASFNGVYGVRKVVVRQNDRVWADGWWFAGVLIEEVA